MANRSGDWFRQGERALTQARAPERDGFHEWACFASRQAAEKAVKALHLARGREAWGHAVSRLLAELPLQVPQDLIEKGRVLDNFHVATRYATGHPEGAPFEHHGPLQGAEAIKHANEITEFVRSRLA